ncbi:ABC transporter ATP-binding protein [Blastopirellula marina]|uniref:ABC transporter ATP-binding protein n=1 Tax=Blastopirellula marina TaxID=124 RepID=UPI00130493B1|nr:ABC transporter ATP-binding protein [Blastopirellula marina]
MKLAIQPGHGSLVVAWVWELFVIEVINLVKTFAGNTALKGVNFTVHPGEATGCLGPNGAGKSTIMKTLAGLLRPTSGEVRICGHSLATEPLEAKKRLGYIPETAAMYTGLTASEYLSFVAELYHVDREYAAEQIRKLMEAFRLTEAADRQIDALSKGMRQKVLISSALLHDPDVLIFDEPLNGLDVNAALTFRRIVEDLIEQGKTVLYCSHILDVVERLCTRVIVLNEGEVVADDQTANLLASNSKGSLEAVFQELTRIGPEIEWGAALAEGRSPSPPVRDSSNSSETHHR